MRMMPKLAAAFFALAALAGCGQERGADGLTQDERDRLNAAAESLDINNAEVVDASPDSLVANDEWSAAESGGNAEAANAASNVQQ